MHMMGLWRFRVIRIDTLLQQVIHKAGRDNALLCSGELHLVATEPLHMHPHAMISVLRMGTGGAVALDARQAGDLGTAPDPSGLLIAPVRKLAIMYITVRESGHKRSLAKMFSSGVLNPPPGGIEVFDDLQGPFDDSVGIGEVPRLLSRGPRLAVHFTGGTGNNEVKIPW